MICPERIGGGYGGSCGASGPFENEDGGEIIEKSPLAAITRERPA